MIRSRFLLWAVGACWATWLAAAPPSSERVAALLRQLESQQQRDRAAALRELETLGPAVLPLLPESEAIVDVDARDALARLRIVLQRRLARESALPRVVNLVGQYPLPQLVEEIARQTGNSLAVVAGSNFPPPLDVAWERTPFWTALEDINRTSGWQPYWNPELSRWELKPVEPKRRDLASAVSGPFRVVLRALNSRPLPNQSEHLWRLDLILQAESRLQPLFLSVRSADWTAQAAKTTIHPWNLEDDYELSFGTNGREVQWTMSFVAPPSLPEETTWSVQGRGHVHLAAGAEPFVYESAVWSRGKNVRRGSVSVRFRPVEVPPESERIIRFILSYDQGGPAFESHRVGMFAEGGRLETLSGEHIPYKTYEVITEGNGTVVLEYRFDPLPSGDFRFIYVAPTLWLDVPFEVTLDRLPRPTAY